MRKMGQLFDLADRGTAYLCVGGWGRAAYAAALQRGLRVPDDISLMCLADDGSAEEAAVDQMVVGYHGMGRMAVKELCELIEAPELPRAPVVVPFEFRQVGSVASPKR